MDILIFSFIRPWFLYFLNEFTLLYTGENAMNWKVLLETLKEINSLGNKEF